MKNSVWIRVNPKSRCSICNKGDWCTYCPELGLAHCMRVQSDRPSRNKMGGWLHKVGDSPIPFTPKVNENPKPKIDFYRMWRTWKENTKAQQLHELGESLGLDSMALCLIGAAWAPPHKAWAFPMHDGEGNVCGIRLRSETRKFAVLGSKAGVFLPPKEHMAGQILICEGPTDSAAALQLGYGVIGRPSCLGCHEQVLQNLARLKVRRVIMVSDNDVAGMMGAKLLQATLKIPNLMFIPPAKDLRQFLVNGGNRQVVESIVKDTIWTNPQNK